MINNFSYNFYTGTYRDYDKRLVLQVTDDKDCLSNEIIADSFDCLTFNTTNQKLSDLMDFIYNKYIRDSILAKRMIKAIEINTSKIYQLKYISQF